MMISHTVSIARTKSTKEKSHKTLCIYLQVKESNSAPTIARERSLREAYLLSREYFCINCLRSFLAHASSRHFPSHSGNVFPLHETWPPHGAIAHTRRTSLAKFRNIRSGMAVFAAPDNGRSRLRFCSGKTATL